MELLALDVPLDNFTLTEDVTAQTEPSSMELNVASELLIDVSPFQTRIGTEPTVFAYQATQLTEIHAIATASSLEISVKDVPQSPTQSGLTESVNVTMAMLM